MILSRAAVNCREKRGLQANAGWRRSPALSRLSPVTASAKAPLSQPSKRGGSSPVQNCRRRKRLTASRKSTDCSALLIMFPLLKWPGPRPGCLWQCTRRSPTTIGITEFSGLPYTTRGQRVSARSIGRRLDRVQYEVAGQRDGGQSKPPMVILPWDDEWARGKPAWSGCLHGTDIDPSQGPPGCANAVSLTPDEIVRRPQGRSGMLARTEAAEAFFRLNRKINPGSSITAIDGPPDRGRSRPGARSYRNLRRFARRTSNGGPLDGKTSWQASLSAASAGRKKRLSKHLYVEYSESPRSSRRPGRAAQGTRADTPAADRLDARERAGRDCVLPLPTDPFVKGISAEEVRPTAYLSPGRPRGVVRFRVRPFARPWPAAPGRGGGGDPRKGQRTKTRAKRHRRKRPRRNRCAYRTWPWEPSASWPPPSSWRTRPIQPAQVGCSV